MLTYKEFRKKLLTELEQRGIKFEITSMTSVNGEKERISIAFSNFTTYNAVDSDHKPETFGLYPDHEYANYLGLCESESESPIERIVDDALQIMSQLSEKVSLEYVNSLLKLRDEDIIYQLINAKKNEELLKKVPHRIVADDLAVIYRIYKTEIDENSDEKLVTSTIILNSVMEESRYTEEKFFLSWLTGLDIHLWMQKKKYYLCRFQTLIQTICGQSQILMTATELQLFSILTKSRDLRMNWKMT